MPLAIGLAATLLLARVLSLWGRMPSTSWYSPMALVWQDAAIVVVFALLSTWSGREGRAGLERALRVSYLVLVALAAINVPVIRTLGSPITVPMLRAAGGPLTDSVVHVATFGNILAIVAVLGVSVIVPFAVGVQSLATSHVTSRARTLIVSAGALAVVGGLVAPSVPTAGLERSALVALASTAFPRVRGVATAGDTWRTSFGAVRQGDAQSTRPSGADSAQSGDADLRKLRGAATGRNVLLVVLESTAASYLAPWGAATDPMPRLSALARDAVLFENAYAAYPESVKGLVATLASQYPAFDVPAESHAGAMRTALPAVLASAGYRTALFHSGRMMYLGMAELLAPSGFDTMDDAADISGERESSFGVDDVATVRQLLRWVDRQPAGQPFFATYLPIAGHHPYATATPPRTPHATDRDRYLAALGESDAALAALLDGLAARHLDSSTVVVVVSDHGEAFGQHVGNDGHTLALYEENVHVPMLIAVPHAAHERVARVASLLDVAPTILDLVGVRAPTTFQGVSLLGSGQRTALFFTDYSQASERSAVHLMGRPPMRLEAQTHTTSSP